MRSPGRHLILAAITMTVAVGCRVDTTTTVTVHEDGSGTVAVEVILDAEAFERVDDFDTQLRVADLEASGWQISGPEPTDDEGRRVVVTKPFAEPGQAATVLAEITGPDGALVAATVQRSKSFARVEQRFEATLDLSGGIEAFGDAELTEVLAGLAIGQEVTALEEELGAPLAELTSFAVVVDLPSGAVATSGDPAVSELEGRKVFRWEGSLGDPPVELRAQTREVGWPVIGLVGLAVASGLTLIILLVARVARRRRPTTVRSES